MSGSGEQKEAKEAKVWEKSSKEPDSGSGDDMSAPAKRHDQNRI
jgi:hypothetical protein